MALSYIRARSLYVHHVLSPSCVIVATTPPGGKEKGKKYRDMVFSDQMKGMKRKGTCLKFRNLKLSKTKLITCRSMQILFQQHKLLNRNIVSNFKLIIFANRHLG